LDRSLDTFKALKNSRAALRIHPTSYEPTGLIQKDTNRRPGGTHRLTIHMDSIYGWIYFKPRLLDVFSIDLNPPSKHEFPRTPPRGYPRSS